VRRLHTRTSACTTANDAPSCGLPLPSTWHDSELMLIPSKWISSPVCASRGVVGGRRATHDQDNDGAVQQWLRQRAPDQPEPVASCAFSATSNATQVHFIVGCVNEAREETEPALVLGLSESEECFCRTNVSAFDDGRVGHRAHRLPTLLLAFMRRHRAPHLRSWRTYSLGDKSCSISSRNPRYIIHMPTRVLLPHESSLSLTLTHIDEPILVVVVVVVKRENGCKALEKRITHGLDLSQAHQGSSNQCASTPTHGTTSARHTIASSKENECCNQH